MALTSMNQVEFAALLEVFGPLVDKKLFRFTLKGKRRKRLLHQEASNSSLYGAARKLEFILMYLKENPNQAYHGYVFGIGQSKVSEWVRFLSPVLEQALQQLGCVPQSGNRWKCQDEEAKYLIGDVTERQVPRRSDHHAQKEEYSAKKKCHTMKNLAITDQRGYVLFVSATYEGTTHDKTLWDDMAIELTGHNILLDLGFKGVEHHASNIILPFKKPRNKELSDLQKLTNQQIARMRVRIEHAFAGIKRLKIIRNKIRLKGYDIRDQIMRIATAIHNLRLRFR